MRTIIVCGSRTFDNRVFLEAKLSKLTKKLTKFEVVTGACPTGADKLAEVWASNQFRHHKKVVIRRFHADWASLGRSAGPIRNQEMCDYVGPQGVCVAFRVAAGSSPGTDDMVARARKAGMQVFLYQL